MNAGADVWTPAASQIRPTAAPRLDRYINVSDFQKVAARRLPRPILAFLEGGAEDETTVARNRAAFSDWGLVPRSMCDVSTIDASVVLLGQKLPWPYVVGPTGMPGLIHGEGELAIARAAAAVGALYSLSTMASRSIEEVARATSAPKIFQLYLFRDRGLSRELIQRAKQAGYCALMLTVDVQVSANRERDKRTGMLIPPRLTARTVFDMALRPAWCWKVLLRRPVTLANFDGKRAKPGMPLLSFISEQFDRSITWRDVEWVAQQWGGPLAIKGIMRPADAVEAVSRGASTIVLSNHGGRQLDGAAAPLDVLPEAADKLAGRADIVLDGGIRRGTDMLKAMALGATACMGGRIGLYGLATAGEAGVRRVFELLRTEFERDMALLGVSDTRQISPDALTAFGGCYRLQKADA